MRENKVLCSFLFLIFTISSCVNGEDPYRFFTWNVTYGDIWPLGVKQQGILINGQFPGPKIDCVTNDNLIISVFNSLDEPFLLSWNGIQQRRNSFEDGVYGTTCPIPPGKNFTYILQVKDQIGSYYYFPSLAFHKAAGAFGGISIASRPRIPVPFPPPDGDFTILTGDWFKKNHTDLKAILDSGSNLPFPDGLLINGRGANGYTFTVEQGKTYRFRISNVGLTTSINFRIQGHTMKLVEVEGSHTLQNIYSSLDVHLGQTYSVLVTADQPPKDYYVVASTRFTNPVLTTTAILHYANSAGAVWNLTASGPRPNPQGSYHYGLINTTRTIRLANSAPIINGKQRYAVNSVSFIPADTPLKIADYFKISGVFNLGTISDNPTGGGGYLQTSVMAADFRAYIEIVFENSEDTINLTNCLNCEICVMDEQFGWRPMDTCKQIKLQLEGHRLALHCSGVSKVMDCNLHGFGQCRNVEHKIRELGKAILRPAVLPSSLLSGKLMEGRVSYPEECSSLRSRLWEGKLGLSRDSTGPVLCHEGVTVTDPSPLVSYMIRRLSIGDDEEGDGEEDEEVEFVDKEMVPPQVRMTFSSHNEAHLTLKRYVKRA
ncbi:hypothetical protein Syun_010018 [Stephania yunnanensis]|uniref:Uncharacterized protein n=1 Tax=Stephania yunnanensis TaxID=152371 RepID=A0AAP0KHV7_9MAGN